MAQTISDTVLSALAAAYFGRVAAQGPATLYAAAFIGASSGLAGGTEATGGSYARVAIANNQSTGFSAPSGSGGSLAVSNASNIQFPRSTAAWGTVNCIRLYDAAASGNLIAGAILSPTATVDAAGVTVTIEAGNLVFTLASA